MSRRTRTPHHGRRAGRTRKPRLRTLAMKARRWLALSGLTAVTLLVAVAVVSSWGNKSTFEATATPLEEIVQVGDIEVVAPSVDLGRVPLDTFVDHEFVLRNVGERPVTLGDVFVQTLEGC